MGGWQDLRGSIGLFTRLPVGLLDHGSLRPGRMLLAGPAVGAVVAVPAAALGTAVLQVGSTWLAALSAVAVAAYLTRGLHLDGLADVADGLGSGRPPQQAVAIMQRSDIGPFGVVALVLSLLLQVGLLDVLTAAHGWRGLAVGLLVALPAGRAAALWSCRRGVPAAAGSKLGAWVAGSVASGAGAVVLAALCGVAAVLTALLGSPWPGLLAVFAACCAGALLERVARRRFGGITGDVLGASVEIGQTAALLTLVVGLA